MKLCCKSVKNVAHVLKKVMKNHLQIFNNKVLSNNSFSTNIFMYILDKRK